LNVFSAREVDEKVAAEIKAALDTGVLKNHRNDTFTRLARNTARTTHAYKKAQETRQQKKAINIVDEELVSLKDSQKENAARIKELKAAKSKIALTGKGKSSRAESNSSGKVAVMGVSKRKRANEASKLATIREGMFIHSIHHVYFLLNIYSFFILSGIDHKRASATSLEISKRTKPLEAEDSVTDPFQNVPMDTAFTDCGPRLPSTKAGIHDVDHFGYMMMCKFFSFIFETTVLVIFLSSCYTASSDIWA
jgi:hypothetical protein